MIIKIESKVLGVTWGGGWESHDCNSYSTHDLSFIIIDQNMKMRCVFTLSSQPLTHIHSHGFYCAPQHAFSDIFNTQTSSFAYFGDTSEVYICN